MATIPSVLQRILAKKTLVFQFLFVTLAFALMVISSSLYNREILRNHLNRQANDMLTQTKLKIESELVEPQTALSIVSNTVRNMILRGNNAGMVREYLKIISAEVHNKTVGFEFDDIFGYFEAYGGVLFHAENWEGEENFDPADHAWYKAAVAAGDTIAVTPMYFDTRSNDYNITYVRRIFSDKGRPLGIVGISVPLIHIRNYVVDMNIGPGGYGILLNEHYDVIAHPKRDFLGKTVREINADMTFLADDLDLGKDAFEREIENYQDKRAVAFTMRLENGWVLIIMTPMDAYYQEMRNMTLMTGILGAIFAAVLFIILIRIDIAKSKVDEQNRQKGILLANMEKLREADERTQIMLDATPLGITYWSYDIKIITCNEEAARMHGLKSKQEYIDRFDELSPEYQPCGRRSKEMSKEFVRKALKEGSCYFEWIHQKLNGEQIPCEITLVRVKDKNDYSVLGYVRDLRELKQMMKEIKQRDELLNTVNHAAALLLTPEEEKNMEASILAGMELLGRCVEVDRVQIWQNERIDGTRYFVHKYEWLSDIGRRKPPVPVGLKFPYSDKPEWERKFLKGEYINSPVRELPQDDQDFLNVYDIKSIVIIPLFLQDEFWGFFSLDDCRKERSFPDDVINILHSGGLLIANAFLRSNMMQNIHSTAAQLESALKEAQDANKAKSKFLAAMSHEIRTPMNVVLGIAESQLLNENHPQKLKEAFENIYDSGNLLLHIINDILDLSKIEAGRFEINPTNYETFSLINDAANMNVMQHGQKPIDFKLQVDENIPSYLFGDELRIKQILNNLLSNAFKYTAAGEVALSFSVEKTPQNKTALLVISVSDTGQGMSKDQIDKIFDEYSRFNLEANRTTVGTGLGMTITRNLVKMMDGDISVDSTPDKGTTFTVRIPQKITSDGIIGKEAAENLQEFNFSSTARKRRTAIIREPMPYGKVLVVDDMPSNLNVAKLLLNPYELQIETAESGFEAVDLIKKGNVYDMVFMDHMMPKMDGIEATKKMRDLGYKHPIFALTANAITGQQEMFLANGFDGYISKPIDMRQLNDSLNKFIRDKKRRTEPRDKSLKPALSAETVPGPGETIEKEHPTITIPGIDTETGLALYNGETDIYTAVLRSYVPNALQVIDKMRDVSKETLPDYAVKVHGLKSISAGIGAENLRKGALNLELDAKAGNLSGVLAKNEALLKEAGIIVSAVQAWLEELDSRNPKPLLESPNRVLLARLRKSCEAYDMKGIDEVMDELESADYKTDASLVSWLREKINALDFSSAASRLSTYEEET